MKSWAVKVWLKLGSKTCCIGGRGSDRGSKPGRYGAASRAHLGRAAACPKARDQRVDGGGGVSVQLNERVLSSSSSYLLRVLHSSFFAAGSKVALHLNFTKKTYDHAGMEALMSHASVPSSHFRRTGEKSSTESHASRSSLFSSRLITRIT